MASAGRDSTTGPSGGRARVGREKLAAAGDLTYLSGALLLTLVRVVPAATRVRLFDRISPFLARLLLAVNARPARVIRHNLQTIFGAQHPPYQVERDVQRQLSVTVWNALVMGALPALGRQQTADLVQVEGTSRLDELLSEHRPVLIMSYHFGVQPLVVAAILYARGYPIHVITHVGGIPGNAGRFARLYLTRLQRIGDQFPVINPREGIQKQMLDALTSGQCLYITPDYMLPQEERRPGSAFEAPVNFLGRWACLQTGGLRLAKRYGAGVVTVLSVPIEGRRWRLVVEPLALPTPGFRPDDLRQDLQACMNRFEGQLLAWPHLWLDLRRDDLTERLTAAPVDAPRENESEGLIA